MKVLIIEDEKPASEKLKQLLLELNESIQVLDCLESVGDSAEWLSIHEHPDLIFMDIQLADGLSFEIFDLVKIEVPVIFTTAYNQYAIKAFKVNSIDYLLKPFSLEDLKLAISKYKSLFGQSDLVAQKLNNEISLLSKQLSPNYKKRFFIKIGQRYASVPVINIESFFSSNKSSFIMTTEGKMLAVDYSLDRLEGMLNPSDFFRINRNFIISAQAVKDVVIYSGSRLKLKLLVGKYEENLIVSRDKVNRFKRWMDQ